MGDTVVSDKSKGFYAKFKVTRVNGTSEPGKKHHNCRYFVLDIDHDPHAVAALQAYEDSCIAEFPLLARDIRKMLIRMRSGLCQFQFYRASALVSCCLPEGHDGCHRWKV